MKGKNSHISERKFYYGKNHSHFFRGGGGGGGGGGGESCSLTVFTLCCLFLQILTASIVPCAV